LFAFNTACAQGVKGIFISASDLKTNNYFPSSGSKCKIRIYEMPYRSYVRVKYNDTVLILSKDSIFGYLDKSGFVNRFFKRYIYSVINPKETILLYKRTIESGNPKDFRTNIAYYFSKDATSEILPLSIANVLKAFEGNDAFSDLIETHFRSSDDLLAYDNVHSQYKLNHLLELSKKQTHEK
jgi:hypothetical protein